MNLDQIRKVLTDMDDKALVFLRKNLSQMSDDKDVALHLMRGIAFDSGDREKMLECVRALLAIEDADVVIDFMMNGMSREMWFSRTLFCLGGTAELKALHVKVSSGSTYSSAIKNEVSL